MGEVFKVERGYVLAVDVESDEADGVDGAAVYLCEIDGIDVGVAGVDEGEDGAVVGYAEGCAGVVGAGGIDGGGVDKGRVVQGVGQAGYGRVGSHWGASADASEGFLWDNIVVCVRDKVGGNLNPVIDTYLCGD